MGLFLPPQGFIFGYIYGGRERGHRLEWWDFMAKRFAGLYPLYFFSLLLGK
jgi:peptidoglycan/LPS O-acetylase OafA/YrhL